MLIDGYTIFLLTIGVLVVLVGLYALAYLIFGPR